jgi:hypothetical protein
MPTTRRRLAKRRLAKIAENAPPMFPGERSMAPIADDKDGTRNLSFQGAADFRRRAIHRPLKETNNKKALTFVRSRHVQPPSATRRRPPTRPAMDCNQS